MTEITNALSICQIGDTSYSLVTFYDEGNALNATGHLLASPVPDPNPEVDQDSAKYVLNTSHPLCCMWKYLPIQFGSVRVTGSFLPTPKRLCHAMSHALAKFTILDTSMQWNALKPDRLAQGNIITAIGGRDDDFVLVGMFSGRILLWDGAQWNMQSSPATSGIGAFVTGPNGDVFATAGSDVLRLVGSIWEKLPLGDMCKHNVITGIDFTPEASPIITTNKGSVISIDASGPRLVFKCSSGLWGIIRHGDGFILAGCPIGAWQLGDDGKLSELRTTFGSYGLQYVNGRFYFVPAEQNRGPTLVVHDPVAARWFGWVICKTETS
jgi:hypothetical protein